MKSITVMLVEDNEGDIFLTLEAFEESKIINHVIVKTDGEQAINYFNDIKHQEDIPSLILLDINLPKITGHEVLLYLKNHEKYKAIPIIMLTTSPSEKDMFMAYKNYVNCYIIKPVEITELMMAIEKIEDFWVNIVSIPAIK